MFSFVFRVFVTFWNQNIVCLVLAFLDFLKFLELLFFFPKWLELGDNVFSLRIFGIETIKQEFCSGRF